ncbi:MAG TPA: GNAT family N-acetyltransferase [Streptosporangiaceae bacterium]|nr:GNAT family N-acetyltransferase [Streptosporangiaceae bacterium]
MTSAPLRIVRASPGLVWRALDADQVVGAVTAFLRPDDRWFVHFDAASRADSYRPLLAAVAGNAVSDLYATVEESDDAALELFTRLGFTVSRREGNYLIPVDPQVTGLRATADPAGIVIISAADAYEDQLRLLDDVLRQDVPGTDGWKWDPGDFREQTFSQDFDRATYLIAVDAASGDYLGLVRVWDSPGMPRLGLIAIVRQYRHRGLAKLLLARAFGVLHERGKTEVTAEIDDANTACRSLLLGLGARRHGGSVELVTWLPGRTAPGRSSGDGTKTPF